MLENVMPHHHHHHYELWLSSGEESSLVLPNAVAAPSNRLARTRTVAFSCGCTQRGKGLMWRGKKREYSYANFGYCFAGPVWL